MFNTVQELLLNGILNLKLLRSYKKSEVLITEVSLGPLNGDDAN